MAENNNLFPSTNGPFRGVVFQFKNFSMFVSVLEEISKFHGFLTAQLDNFKCLTHFKTPSNVADVLESYQNGDSYKRSIYMDNADEPRR